MKTLFLVSMPIDRFSWWRWAALLVSLATTAGCEGNPQQARTIAPPSEPVPVPLPSSAQLGYHRYVGTLGNRRVLAEINIWLEQNADPDHLLYAKLEGSFYYRATGLSGGLGTNSYFHPSQWMETYYWPGQGRQPVAVLCAEQPPGGVLLTGFYMPQSQPLPLPLRLRESYADGVRYELLREESSGPARRQHNGRLDSAWVEQTYLHLLGPDTLRPALARLQCPPPAVRRHARQRRLHRLAPTDYYRDRLNITLNEGNLLAYRHDIFQGKSFSRYDQESSRCYLLDLETGRHLPQAAQLQPGGLKQVQQLLSSQALDDTTNSRQRAHWWDGGQLLLPDAGFEITPTGWRAHYAMPEYAEESHTYGQTLTWATLRPLVLPTSPLNRLLRLRGL